MQRGPAGVLAALLGVGSWLLGCSADHAGPPPGEEAAAGPPPQVVRVVRPEPATGIESHPSSLYVERDVHVTTRRSGVIERVLADRGDPVRAGQALAELETDIASRELEMAEQDLLLADKEHERKRALRERGIVSEQEALEAQTARDQARSKVELSRAWFERCTVRAPFDGVVVERWAVAGQRVREEDGSPLFRVVAREPLRARVDVPEERLGEFALGLKAWIEVPGQEGSYPGRVVFVSPAIDPASGTAPVIVETERAGGSLRVGATVRVRSDRRAAGSAPVRLPREALGAGSAWEGSETIILVVAQGRADARRVEVVEARGGSVMVRGEIGPDDRVIVDAPGSLAEGEPVVVGGEGP